MSPKMKEGPGASVRGEGLDLRCQMVTCEGGKGRKGLLERELELQVSL